MFLTGQKVVCIDGQFPEAIKALYTALPVQDVVYVVRGGLEIADYLRESNHQGPFCILDDDSDMAHLKHYLVQTTWATGLQPEHVEKAVKMMNQNNK